MKMKMSKTTLVLLMLSMVVSAWPQNSKLNTARIDEITGLKGALNKDFFYDEPKVYFMHIGGEGSVAKLAAGVRKVLDTAKEIRAAHPQPVRQFGGPGLPAESSITAKPIEDIFGVHGQSNSGMFK